MTDKLAAAEESQWRNLETQTGKSKAQWLKLATAKKLDKHGELMAWLKNEHDIGHGYANLIAIRAREAASGGTSAPDDLVLAQYAGAKTALKPIYDNVIAIVQVSAPTSKSRQRRAMSACGVASSSRSCSRRPRHGWISV